VASGVGGERGAGLASPAPARVAVSDEVASAHRAFATNAFNATWELIDTAERSPDDDRRMLTLAFASRWHWTEVGTAENIVIADWLVAHVASLLGEASLAQPFARSAYDAARAGELPDWLRASTAEGMARAAAAAGDESAYHRHRDEARALVESLSDEEDRALIAAQLASIAFATPPPATATSRPAPVDAEPSAPPQ
jgi:hypothetical protein